MDEMTLLRRMHGEHSTSDPEVLARGRRALIAEAMASQQPEVAVLADRKPRRTVVRRVALGGLAAALVAGALVVSNFTAIGEGASAEAADILERAALASIKASDPLVAPGQYLEVRTTSVYPAFVTAPGEESERWSWETAPVYLAPTLDVKYIPADRSEEWVWTRTKQEPTSFFGPGAREAAERDWAEWNAQPTEVVRAKNGEFYDGPYTYEDLDAFPLEGGALIDHIYATHQGGSNSPHEDAYVRIVEILRLGDIPAELRAALYEAMARIPGISVTADQATLNGKSGVAIGREEPDRNYREEIIIDPETGWMIGERQITTGNYGRIPPGVTTVWTATTVAVVDSAP